MNTFLKKIRDKIFGSIYRKLDDIKILQAKQLIQNFANSRINSLKEIEFKVFSQFGEDGIIQYLLQKIRIKNEFFIEFGVENYTESNTRFLMINNNWSGLIIDGSSQNINFVKKDDIYWRHQLTAISCFVDCENINSIFEANVPDKEIGILSIDIDGNDYWIWKTINSVNPQIVVCEYNSVFGKDLSVSVPYKKDFFRTNEHYSNLYWGASLQALCQLAIEKGYSCVGTTSAGQNAFFVRNDSLNELKPLTAIEAFNDSKYRESRDKKGNLSYLSGKDRLRAIEGMPVFDIKQQKIVLISQLINKS